MRKLPVLAINMQALLFVWEHRRRLLQALIATSLLFAISNVAKLALARAQALWSLVILDIVLYWVVLTLFAVTGHRIVLLGEASVPKYGLFSWTSRETRFLGWLVVTSLYGLGISIPFALLYVAIGMAKLDFIQGREKFLVVLVMLPAMYVFTRLAVLFPATAIGERRNTDWAFEVTAGNGWRMTVATYLIPGLFGLATHALPFEHNSATSFLAGFLNSAIVAIGIVVLSLSFRFLTTRPNGSDT